jgi:hypothetical protein
MLRSMAILWPARASGYHEIALGANWFDQYLTEIEVIELLRFGGMGYAYREEWMIIIWLFH